MVFAGVRAVFGPFHLLEEASDVLGPCGFWSLNADLRHPLPVVGVVPLDRYSLYRYYVMNIYTNKRKQVL